MTREPEHACPALHAMRFLQSHEVVRRQEGLCVSHLVATSSPAVGEERLGVPGAAPKVSGVGHVGGQERAGKRPPRS